MFIWLDLDARNCKYFVKKGLIMKMSWYPICDKCIEGRNLDIGESCHTPGCIFCFRYTPQNLSDIKDCGKDPFEIDEMDKDEIKNHHQD